MKYIIITLLLICTAYSQGTLQFSSGFEDDVYVTSSRGGSRYTINGTDNSTPSGVNNWDNLTTYLDWMNFQGSDFEGASMAIVADPEDANNEVMRLWTYSADCGGGSCARAQWHMNQVSSYDVPDWDNAYEKQYFKWRMYIPSDVSTAVGSGASPEWYMIWESHWYPIQEARHAIYMSKSSGENWRWSMMQGHPTEQETNWGNSGTDVEPIFDEWFTFELFFEYDSVNGRFWAAQTQDGGEQEVIGDLQGQTRFGSHFHEIMHFKLYHGDTYLSLVPGGLYQYYDDFEIWSDYPPGYNDNENQGDQPQPPANIYIH